MPYLAKSGIFRNKNRGYNEITKAVNTVISETE